MNNVSITFIGDDVDQDTTLFAQKKFKKIANLLPLTATINMTFSQKHNKFTIDADITAPGKHYHANSTQESYYTCIKHLAEVVLRQITTSKSAIH
jgi:ribosome-associated translation inhibitor RaiA